MARLGNHLKVCKAHVFGCVGFFDFVWIVPRGGGVDEGKLHLSDKLVQLYRPDFGP